MAGAIDLCARPRFATNADMPPWHRVRVGEGRGVGPFADAGLEKPLGLAVDSWRIGAGALVGCGVASARRADIRRRLLIFVIGGGPTGFELAGAMAELTRHAMPQEFRRIDPAAARVVLVEAGPRQLPSFPEELGAVARNALERRGCRC
jgi:hypothetical protein